MITRLSKSPNETARLAEKFGQRVREGTVIALTGELGAGKTLFVQNLARTLGVESNVTSPTFNLMNVYEGVCPIVHFDLYRLQNEEDLEEIGFYEYVESEEGIVLIEWADKFPDALPEDYVLIHFDKCESTSRKITFDIVGEEHEDFLEELEEIL
ncbi:MAG: tRNA (adenosine(37)-N6)-threonylcarbamoyltransferase complex ATPase subunit type 1 TsaE [Selenomonadaceae bacterium]|nr:tRNA (adenosine(37)-N6)-threonylcarbamoyltransferase complex ATPase subunit type 1 TsaE [Selenomonadaceae bacterium]